MERLGIALVFDPEMNRMDSEKAVGGRQLKSAFFAPLGPLIHTHTHTVQIQVFGCICVFAWSWTPSSRIPTTSQQGPKG